MIKTTEGSRDAALVAVKIRRVLDVLRYYVANWPWLRGDKDEVPLEQSWRGKPKKFRVQVADPHGHSRVHTVDVPLHDNATIGQLATETLNQLSHSSAAYTLQLYSDQNSSNQPYESSHRVQLVMPTEHQTSQNNGVQFFGRITNPPAHANQRSKSNKIIQPDKSLAEYKGFIPNLIKLYDLALELDSFDLCSSIKQILLILPANDSKLLALIKQDTMTAVIKQENFEDYFNTKSLAQNWYNVMILRMILLPSDSRKYRNEPKIYQYFFATHGSRVLFRLLCETMSNTVTVDKLRQADTYTSFISALVEICRFVTLVITKREELELIAQRKPSKVHNNTLSVLSNLDQFIFELGTWLD